MKKKFEKVRIPGSGFEIKLNGGQIRAQNAKLCLKTYFYNLFKKNFSGPMKVMITLEQIRPNILGREDFGYAV